MSTVALERQIRPIYGPVPPYCPDLSRSWNPVTDALDTGSNKSALVSCNKLLKKYPQNELIKVPSTPVLLWLGSGLPTHLEFLRHSKHLHSYDHKK